MVEADEFQWVLPGGTSKNTTVQNGGIMSTATKSVDVIMLVNLIVESGGVARFSSGTKWQGYINY